MIITIANSKGGSGKSTITINLATKLALEGKDIIVIDTDKQKSVDKFCSIRNDKILASLFSVVCKSGNSLKDTIKAMSGKYDIVLIDTMATMNNEQKNGILLSDFVIIPTTTSQIDLSELLEMFDYIKDCKIINDTLKAFVLFNRISPNPFLAKELIDMQEFISAYKAENGFDDIITLDSILCDRVDYKRSIANGKGVCEMSESQSSIEFGRFYDEFMQKIKGIK